MLTPIGFPLETVVLLLGIVAVSVWIDLFMHQNKENISLADAAGWSIFWILLAVGFYFYIKVKFGAEYGDLFLAGYVLEKSLSIDNMMVFVAVFSSFGIKGILQHRILYYGIIGALLFRAIFIIVGTTLFGLSSWIELLFALIVAWTAWAMFKGSDDGDGITDYSNHWSVRYTKKLFPIYPKLFEKRFFVTRKEIEENFSDSTMLKTLKKSTLYATPMLLCLICIEFSDIVFSFDSVPAIIAVTRDPLLVYAAVIFAILGLRNLYFMLAIAEKHLCHLDKAVALILAFIAIKLGASAVERTFGISTFHISTSASLYVVLGFIFLGVVASFVWPEKEVISN